MLVTGAAGFLGVNLVRRLAGAGKPVVALIREPPDREVLHFLATWQERVSYVIGDVRDRDAMCDLIRQYAITHIIHAAAVTPTPDQERHAPAAVIDTNLMGTVNVLEAARQGGIARVVYVSSDAVYRADPKRTEPIEECAPVQPENLYAIGKVAAEQVCRRYAELTGLSVIVGRLGTMYGPMERRTDARTHLSIVYRLMDAAITCRPVRLAGLDTRRDYIHAFDAVEALVRLLECEAPQWHVYNVASGKASSLRALVTILQQLASGWRWHEVADDVPADIALSATQSRAPLRIARLTTDTGYTPALTLAAGLRDYHAFQTGREPR